MISLIFFASVATDYFISLSLFYYFDADYFAVIFFIFLIFAAPLFRYAALMLSLSSRADYYFLLRFSFIFTLRFH